MVISCLIKTACVHGGVNVQHATEYYTAPSPSVLVKKKKQDIVRMISKYSSDPSLVPEADFTQSGVASITAVPASFTRSLSGERHHLHNETQPRQQSPSERRSPQSARASEVPSSQILTLRGPWVRHTHLMHMQTHIPHPYTHTHTL